MSYATMADYYKALDFLPTYGKFQTEADFKQHAVERKTFFNDLLYIPNRTMQGAHLIEFGPDTGENALVFAKYGAKCTLVEPNIKAHPIIREYFDRYFLSPQLTDLMDYDLAHMPKAAIMPVYDFVIAEGFIYTVKPADLWLGLFANLLRGGGLAVISYYDIYGGWIELFTKAIYYRVKSLTGWPGIQVANRLFAAKWSTVGHMRSIGQWIDDVLENPFVRLSYFLESEKLFRLAEPHGLRLYSSWPQFRDGLGIHWHKRALKQAEIANGREAFMARQRLGHMLGRELPLAWPLEKLKKIVTLTDGLIDDFDTQKQAALSKLLAEVDSGNNLPEIKSLQRILRLLDFGDAQAAINFCATDEVWLHLWGSPNQYAVLQKEG